MIIKYKHFAEMIFDVVSIFAILASIFVSLILNKETGTLLLCRVAVYLTIYGFVTLNIKNGSILNQYSLFWMFLNIFSLGQAYIYAFKLEYDRFFIFKYFSMEVIYKYLCFAILGLLVILFSGIRFASNEEKYSDFYIQSDEETLSKNINLVFGILLVVSLPFFLMILVSYVRASFLGGYNEIYDLENDGLRENLSMWCIPSLFALIYGNRDNKSKYIFLALLAGIMLGYLYIGTRSRPLAMLFCTFYLWQKANNKKTSKELIILNILLPIVLIAISAISDTRGMSGRGITEVIQSATASGVLDSVKFAVGEMGATMQVWLRVYRIVPKSYPYNWGFSYVAAILSCIPSILCGGFSFAKYANLSRWISQVEHTTYGLGFSTMAEAYYNFGWIGIIMLYFVGIFIFYWLSGSFFKKLGSYRFVFSTIALYIFATTGRGSIYLCVRYVFYCMLIPYIIIISLNKERRGG